jgi:hypothetical protein
VLSKRESHARIPERTIPVGAKAISEGPVTPGDLAPSIMKRLLTRHALVNFLVPVLGGLLLAFLVGWWIGSGKPGRRREPRASTQGSIQDRDEATPGAVGLGAVVGPARSLAEKALLGPLGRTWQSLRHLAGRGVGAILGWLPPGFKTWWCVRCVTSETEPQGFCTAIRRFACDNLDMPENATLRAIGERMLKERPATDGSALRAVFTELDEATYSGKELNARDWKRRFRKAFKGAMKGAARARHPTKRRRLPELNP